MENIKKIKLMNSNNHPTNYVLKYITNEILKILKLNTSDYEEFKKDLLVGMPYSIYSYNHYKFDWLEPKNCNEDIYIKLLNDILQAY